MEPGTYREPGGIVRITQVRIGDIGGMCEYVGLVRECEWHVYGIGRIWAYAYR